MWLCKTKVNKSNNWLYIATERSKQGYSQKQIDLLWKIQSFFFLKKILYDLPLSCEYEADWNTVNRLL